MALRLAAPAKVNLYLKVLGQRPDGYHAVETCLHTLSLADELSLESAGEGLQLHLRSKVQTGFEVCAGPDNLVRRAGEAFRAATGMREGVRFTLEKRIPAGAGLGGGSSDAATALLLLNAFSGEPLKRRELHGLAAGLGADVPFFLDGGTQIGTGIGDRLEVVPDPPQFHFVLVLPAFGVSTAEVYRRVRAPRLTGDSETNTMATAHADRRRELAVPERFVNDLESAATEVEPRLVKLRDRVVARGFPWVRMSGSGSALFLAFHEAEGAARAAEALDRLDEGVVVLRARSEPSAGSRRPVEIGASPGRGESMAPGGSSPSHPRRDDDINGEGI